MTWIGDRRSGTVIDPPLSEPLLTADEVAALLRVPRSTVYELTRTRRLPHIKVGRRTLFVRVDLDAWVVAQPRHAAAVTRGSTANASATSATSSGRST